MAQKSKEGKTMMVVDKDVHRTAKIAAAIRNMPLQDFVDVTLKNEISKVLKRAK